MTLAADAAANRSRLLRDVAQAIIESGYAVEPRKPYQARKDQIDAIADDVRISAHGKSAAGQAIIVDVMRACDVSRGNARQMIRKARQLRAKKNSIA